MGYLKLVFHIPGEMENLQKVIDPDIGVITNIGDAHRENFPDDKTKAAEKLILFREFKNNYLLQRPGDNSQSYYSTTRS